MTVTPEGIQIDDLETYRSNMHRVFQEVFGDDISLAPEAPAGQISGIIAEQFAKNDESAAALPNAMNPATASGPQLDAIGAMLDVPRQAGSFSTVTLRFTTRADNVTIPAGLQVQTAAPAVVFQTIAAFDAMAAGTHDVDARSTTVGAHQADADTLTEFTDGAPSNVSAVTNPAAATPGTLIEPDSRYRQRIRGNRRTNATVPALKAQMLTLDTGGFDSVIYAEIITNNTDTAAGRDWEANRNVADGSGNDIPANSYIALYSTGVAASDTGILSLVSTLVDNYGPLGIPNETRAATFIDLDLTISYRDDEFATQRRFEEEQVTEALREHVEALGLGEPTTAIQIGAVVGGVTTGVNIVSVTAAQQTVGGHTIDPFELDTAQADRLRGDELLILGDITYMRVV